MKFLTKIKRFIFPPESWSDLTESEREEIMKSSRRERRKLAKAVANSTVLDESVMQRGTNHTGATATGSDPGGAAGSIFAEDRRQRIEQAIREGERSGHLPGLVFLFCAGSCN